MNGIVKSIAFASLFGMTATQAENGLCRFVTSNNWEEISAAIREFTFDGTSEAPMAGSLIILDYDDNLVLQHRLLLLDPELPNRIKNFIEAGAKVFVLTSKPNSARDILPPEAEEFGLSFSKDVFASGVRGVRLAEVTESDESDGREPQLTAYDIDELTGVVYTCCLENSITTETDADVCYDLFYSSMLMDMLHQRLSCSTKGDVLSSILGKGELRSRPAKIVFVDDDRDNIDSVMQAMMRFNADPANEIKIPLLCIQNTSLSPPR
ncbi:MAG: DUF2608 domain-containing protein [Holosporaceae bacterium]|nr:DUF2608 domain-containing protein [Holosporaceae bacterium]